jgi:hypothetical protein
MGPWYYYLGRYTYANDAQDWTVHTCGAADSQCVFITSKHTQHKPCQWFDTTMALTCPQELRPGVAQR